jgi:hypothetical protein
MRLTHTLTTLFALAMFVGNCGPPETRSGRQIDVAHLLNKTRQEVIQVLGEPMSAGQDDSLGTMYWRQEKLPPGFVALGVEFRHETVCQFVTGQAEVGGDPEKVLDLVGLGGVQRECRRMERAGALVVSCVAPPYEAEIVEPRLPGFGTNVKSFTLWRQDSAVTQSLAREFEAGNRGFVDPLRK